MHHLLRNSVLRASERPTQISQPAGCNAEAMRGLRHDCAHAFFHHILLLHQPGQLALVHSASPVFTAPAHTHSLFQRIQAAFAAASSLGLDTVLRSQQNDLRTVQNRIRGAVVFATLCFLLRTIYTLFVVYAEWYSPASYSRACGKCEPCQVRPSLNACHGDTTAYHAYAPVFPRRKQDGSCTAGGASPPSSASSPRSRYPRSRYSWPSLCSRESAHTSSLATGRAAGSILPACPGSSRKMEGTRTNEGRAAVCLFWQQCRVIGGVLGLRSGRGSKCWR